MRTLVLDTSTERGIVAIIESDTLLFSAELPFGLQTANMLLPELQRGLKETGIKLNELAFIGVGVGPGSYTGLRIGAMVAKTLGFSCNLPLIGVCTLESFAPEYDTTFAAIIDAKIGGVYVQIGKREFGKIFYTSAPQVLSLQEAISLLKEIPVFITPNAAQLRPKLEVLDPDAVWQWQECYPSPLQLARVAQDKFARNEFVTDGQLELLYMRKTQAEIEKENKRLTPT